MSKDLICHFCGIGGEREVELGSIYETENVVAHYFCLLFSSGLPQRGEDDEGIFGFLLPDIQKELNRGKKLSCVYCNKKGATIGCLKKKCRRSYHYLCGLKHYTLFKFTDDFRSYCVSHRDYQDGNGIGQDLECPICMDSLRADPNVAVWAPCCKKEEWFHKNCMQQLAISAGYFFKCPLCNDKEMFVEAMQNNGIYVPEKDASWELEPNAYSELERPVRCDASKCKCPEGRKRDAIGTRWEILLCNLCGASGVHVSCGKLRFTTTEWNCQLCINMLNESVKRVKQEVRERRLKERSFREISEREVEDHSKATSGEGSLQQETISEEGSPHSNATSGEGSLYPKATSGEGSPQHKLTSGDTIPQTVLEASDNDAHGIETFSRTPKRKLNTSDICEESPSNISDDIARITYASDSDEEIDVELGEYNVPPQTVIRELEERGEELSTKLLRLKNYALRAQERMQELRLKEVEIVKMARESSNPCNKVPLDKATVMKFFRYNLPLDKMLQTVKVIRAVYHLREAFVISQMTAKKPTQKSNKRRRRTPRLKGVPDINVSLSKNALTKTVTNTTRDLSDQLQKFTKDIKVEADSGENPTMSLRVSDELDRLLDVSHENLSFSLKEDNWNSSWISPGKNLRLNISLSSCDNTPKHIRDIIGSSSSVEETPPALKKRTKNKENTSRLSISKKLENISSELNNPLQPLDISNIVTPGKNDNSTPLSSPLVPTSGSSKRKRGRPLGSKTKNKRSLNFVTPSTNKDDKRERTNTSSSSDSSHSDKGKKKSPPKGDRLVQKTLMSYFSKTPGKTKDAVPIAS